MKPLRDVLGSRPLAAIRRRWDTRQAALPALMLLALVCSFPRQALAIFGIGDLVFDPTAVEELINQLNQAVALYNQEVTTYNLLKSELQSIRSRGAWAVVATALQYTPMANINGEAALLASVVNGFSADVPTAWRKATSALNETAYLAREVPGNSPHLSNAASIEMVDGFAQDSLANLGQFRQIQPQLNNAIGSLEQRQQSVADADNTPVAQQNITNAALLQLIRMQQSTANLHAAALEQLTVANTWQRNAAAEASDIYGGAISSRQNRLADIAGVADTLQTYAIQ